MLSSFKKVASLHIPHVKMCSSLNCKVAVCQMTATNVKENNLKVVQQLVSKAVEQDVKFIFFPESCDYIAKNGAESRNLSETLDGHLMSEYKKLAEINRVWLSIGGVHEINEKQDKMYNTHVIINDHGKVEGIYRKLHLYDVDISGKIKMLESDYIEKGTRLIAPIATPIGQLGLSICYDLRFPELSTILRKMGASVLTYPSAFFTATGDAHWETMLKARAIENQCYVIAAAQYGCHNEKRISFGQAMIVDPWGTIIAECSKYNSDVPTDASIAVASINSTLVNRIRAEMPVFEHRRDDLYKLVTLNGNLNQDTMQYMFGSITIPKETVFYTSQYSYAFTNIRCVVPGHVLIASLRKAKRLQDLSPDEVADFFQTAIKVQKVMEKVYSSGSSTICVQDGVDAGQTIPHVHCHILPRKKGDFERNDDIYAELAKHDKNGSSEPIRNLEEMSKEADLLRNYFI